jgi:hypothetical protein
MTTEITNIKSALSSANPEKVAAMGLTLVREFFPTTQNNDSDIAVKLRLELMANIVKEIGPERFIEAVKQAISISASRYECSIKRIRECAGLKTTPEPNPAMRAWLLVVEVLHRHVRPGPDGGYRLEASVIFQGGEYVTIPVPTIPEPVSRAVRAIGGWGALVETEPAYIAQRMRDFCAVYSENDSLSIDRQGKLEKVG